MTTSHARRLAALAACTTVLVPSAALAAKPTTADGAFTAITKDQSKVIGLGVSKGKITEVFGTLQLKKGGTLCAGQRPKGFTMIDGFLKHTVTPSASGKFIIAAASAKAEYKPGATISASGRFTGSKKATLTVKATFHGCTGSWTSHNVKFYRRG